MSHHIRRNPRKLPSIRRHGLSALLVLGIIILSTITWLNLSAKHKPITRANTEIVLPKQAIVEAPQPPVRLPDLLASDNIPQDVNPTADVGLEGAPKAIKTSRQPQPSTQTKPIKIDGRTINSTQQTITDFTPLVRAPINGLSRMTPYGAVPHIDNNGQKAVNAYAKPFTPKPKTRYVSLVVGGLGLNPLLTRKAITDLPGSVTLSFAADVAGLQGWIDKARAHGHEVMLELPMQGSEPVNSRTLTLAGPKQANIRNLEYLLSRAQGYFAVTNYDGSLLINDEGALLPIITTLKEAGLGFVYDGALDDTRVLPLAQREGLPITSASAFIDEEQQDPVSVHHNIKILIDGSYDNVPIGMGFSYLGTINGIKNWLATKPKDWDIAPVSYALKKR